MIKFPGGGLKHGEGIGNCLKRELMEELGIRCKNPELFYVNDFFQASAFSEEDEIISIYYLLRAENCTPGIPENEFVRDDISFHWQQIGSGLEFVLSMPIDKVVARRITSACSD